MNNEGGFVCAKCGGRFRAPDGENSNGDARARVLIGGRTWCGECAARRFPKHDVSLWAQSPDAIELSHCKTGAVSLNH